MSKHFDKLLKMLKTRQEVTALGFSKEEIQSLASDMDKNLVISEDAADDDVENTINNAIETVIPVLKLAQASSFRIVSKLKKEMEDEKQRAEEEAAALKAKEEEEKRKADDEKRKADDAARRNEPDPKHEENDKKYDELKDMLKTLTDKMSSQDETIKKQNETITNLLRGNVKEKRKAILEAKIKDAGTLGKTYRRAFEKMEFKDDSEFDAFLSQFDEDYKDYEQDIANKRLERDRQVPDPNNPDNHEDKVEVMSDEDIDALADD
jgi:hypothetical protein